MRRSSNRLDTQPGCTCRGEGDHGAPPAASVLLPATDADYQCSGTCALVEGSVDPRRDSRHPGWVSCHSSTRAACWWSDTRRLWPLPHSAPDSGISAFATRWREMARVPPAVQTRAQARVVGTPLPPLRVSSVREAPRRRGRWGVRAADTPGIAGSLFRGGPGIWSAASS